MLRGEGRFHGGRTLSAAQRHTNGGEDRAKLLAQAFQMLRASLPLHSRDRLKSHLAWTGDMAFTTHLAQSEDFGTP
jgi:hypothetical protein